MLEWLKHILELIFINTYSVVDDGNYQHEFIVKETSTVELSLNLYVTLRLKLSSIGEKIEQHLLQSSFIKDEKWIEHLNFGCIIHDPNVPFFQCKIDQFYHLSDCTRW